MSADMYSTNPTIFGSLLIVVAPFAERFTDAASADTAAAYYMVGAGLVLLSIALGVTGSIGGMGAVMRFCSTTGALACIFAAWRFWPPGNYPLLAYICAGASVVLLLWGWGQAGWAGRGAVRKDKG